MRDDLLCIGMRLLAVNHGIAGLAMNIAVHPHDRSGPVDDLPDEIWAKDCPAMDAASDELDDTAAALCFYRPSTLEGLHLKAEFMVATQFFVDVENRDFFTQADQRLPAAWQGCRAVDRQVGMRTAMLHFMSHGFAECGRKPFEINGNGLQHDAT